MLSDQDKEFLRNKFGSELKNDVTLIAFTKSAGDSDVPGMECEFCDETQELLQEVSELSDKIHTDMRDYSPDDELVKSLGIDKLPAIVVKGAGKSGVRYFGIPGGFEFSSLIEDIVDVSANSTDMSDESKSRVKGIDKDVHIQVFVTPTCPYCPSAVRVAHQMAIENPDHIQADAIEAAEFPHLVSRYEIEAVPTIVINDEVQIEGALPEEDFTEQVIQALAA